MNIVLITGASSGIGLALASVYASHGFNLLLTGRNEEALISTTRICQEKYGVHAACLPQDLLENNATKKIYAFCQANNYIVDTLINNAGLGEYASYWKISSSKQQEMLAINIFALVDLTHLFLKDMLQRKKGHIVNIGSVYSYAPAPEQTLYAATKAFVKSFSVGLAAELKNTGVYVSCACPGSTQTQFQQRSGLSFKGGKFSLSAEVVANKIYQALTRHKLIIVPGWYNRVFIFLTRFLPEKFLPIVVKSMNENLRRIKKSS